MGRTINGKTTTLALIGDPVGHSLSPQMHNYACELLGLNYVYVAYTVKEDGVPAAFDAMRALGIRGFNVTMPCKIAAFENVDRHSEAAAIIGACNTVINDGGVLTGHITDGEGYVNMLRDKGIEVAGKKVIVCGAGGAGTAIAVQCALDGAKAVSIFNRRSRSWDRALETAEKIRKVRPDCAVKVCDLTDQALLAEEIAESDILANGTNLGMKPNEDRMVVEDPSVLRPGHRHGRGLQPGGDQNAQVGKRRRMHYFRRQRHAAMAGRRSFQTVHRLRYAGGRSEGQIFR